MILDFVTCLKSRCEAFGSCQQPIELNASRTESQFLALASGAAQFRDCFEPKQRPTPLANSTLLNLDRKLRRTDSAAFNLRPRLRELRTEQEDDRRIIDPS